MNNLAEEQDEEQKKENNIVSFEPKVIQGGGGIGSEWLTSLEDGTMFLANNKREPSFVVQLFRIQGKTEKSVVLWGPGLPSSMYVNPQRFCNSFDLYENLGVVFAPTEEQEQKEIEDGDGDRAEGDQQQPAD